MPEISDQEIWDLAFEIDPTNPSGAIKEARRILTGSGRPGIRSKVESLEGAQPTTHGTESATPQYDVQAERRAEIEAFYAAEAEREQRATITADRSLQQPSVPQQLGFNAPGSGRMAPGGAMTSTPISSAAYETDVREAHTQSARTAMGMSQGPSFDPIIRQRMLDLGLVSPAIRREPGIGHITRVDRPGVLSGGVPEVPERERVYPSSESQVDGTVVQLRDVAKSLGMTGYSRLRKNDLETAIQKRISENFGDRHKLYTRAQVGLGMNVDQVDLVLNAAGIGWNVPTSLNQRAAVLQRFSIERGGGVLVRKRSTQEEGGKHISPALAHSSAVARHAGIALGRPAGEYDIGEKESFLLGQQIVPERVLSMIPGVIKDDQGNYHLGSAEHKAAKALSLGMQQYQAFWGGLEDPRFSTITATGSTVPEYTQRVNQAFFSFSQTTPEGSSWRDPGVFGKASRIVQKRVRLPDDVAGSKDPLSIKVGQEYNRGDSLVAYTGHEGIDLGPHYESSRVLHIGYTTETDKAGKPVQYANIQLEATMPSDAMVADKGHGIKSGGVAKHNLKEQWGVDYLAGSNVRDIYQLAAGVASVATDEEKAKFFGRKFDEPTLNDLESFRTHVVENLTTIESKTPSIYWANDPIVQEKEKTGILTRVTDPNRQVPYGAFLATEKATGIELPFGIQTFEGWTFHKQQINPEVAEMISRTRPDIIDFYKRWGQSDTQSVSDIAVAQLANEGRGRYMTDADATITLDDISSSSMEARIMATDRLSKRGIKQGSDTWNQQLGQEMLRAIGTMYEGKGVRLDIPGQDSPLYMPNPLSVMRYTGSARAGGRQADLPRNMWKLIESQLGVRSGLLRGSQKVASSSVEEQAVDEQQRLASLIRGGGEYMNRASGLKEMTETQDFYKALTGLRTGGGRFGGQIVPSESIPANMWTGGEEILRRTLLTQGDVKNNDDIDTLVYDIMTGRAEGPRVLALRHPVLDERQFSLLEYLSPHKWVSEGYGSVEEYYAQFNTTAGFSRAPIQRGGGDSDRDPHEFLMATGYDFRKGQIPHAVHVGGDVSTAEEIWGAAKAHGAREVESEVGKVRRGSTRENIVEYIKSMGSSGTSDWITRLRRERDMSKSRAGSIYNVFKRTMEQKITGDSEIAKRARGEMGALDLTAIDVKGTSDAFEHLTDVVNSAKLSTGGYYKRKEGTGGYIGGGVEGILVDTARAILDIPNKELSAETKAAMLFNPDVATSDEFQSAVEAVRSGNFGDIWSLVKGRVYDDSGNIIPEAFSKTMPFPSTVVEHAARRSMDDAGKAVKTTGGGIRKWLGDTDMVRGLAKRGEELRAIVGAMSRGKMPLQERLSIQMGLEEREWTKEHVGEISSMLGLSDKDVPSAGDVAARIQREEIRKRHAAKELREGPELFPEYTNPVESKHSKEKHLGIIQEDEGHLLRRMEDREVAPADVTDIVEGKSYQNPMESLTGGVGEVLRAMNPDAIRELGVLLKITPTSIFAKTLGDKPFHPSDVDALADIEKNLPGFSEMLSGMTPGAHVSREQSATTKDIITTMAEVDRIKRAAETTGGADVVDALDRISRIETRYGEMRSSAADIERRAEQQGISERLAKAGVGTPSQFEQERRYEQFLEIQASERDMPAKFSALRGIGLEKSLAGALSGGEKLTEAQGLGLIDAMGGGGEQMYRQLADAGLIRAPGTRGGIRASTDVVGSPDRIVPATEQLIDRFKELSIGSKDLYDSITKVNEAKIQEARGIEELQQRGVKGTRLEAAMGRYQEQAGALRGLEGISRDVESGKITAQEAGMLAQQQIGGIGEGPGGAGMTEGIEKFLKKVTSGFGLFYAQRMMRLGTGLMQQGIGEYAERATGAQQALWGAGEEAWYTPQMQDWLTSKQRTGTGMARVGRGAMAAWSDEYAALSGVAGSEAGGWAANALLPGLGLGMMTMFAGGGPIGGAIAGLGGIGGLTMNYAAGQAKPDQLMANYLERQRQGREGPGFISELGLAWKPPSREELLQYEGLREAISPEELDLTQEEEQTAQERAKTGWLQPFYGIMGISDEEALKMEREPMLRARIADRLGEVGSRMAGQLIDAQLAGFEDAAPIVQNLAMSSMISSVAERTGAGQEPSGQAVGLLTGVLGKAPAGLTDAWAQSIAMGGQPLEMMMREREVAGRSRFAPPEAQTRMVSDEQGRRVEEVYYPELEEAAKPLSPIETMQQEAWAEIVKPVRLAQRYADEFGSDTEQFFTTLREHYESGKKGASDVATILAAWEGEVLQARAAGYEVADVPLPEQFETAKQAYQAQLQYQAQRAPITQLAGMFTGLGADPIMAAQAVGGLDTRQAMGMQRFMAGDQVEISRAAADPGTMSLYLDALSEMIPPDSMADIAAMARDLRPIIDTTTGLRVGIVSNAATREMGEAAYNAAVEAGYIDPSSATLNYAMMGSREREAEQTRLQRGYKDFQVEQQERGLGWSEVSQFGGSFEGFDTRGSFAIQKELRDLGRIWEDFTQEYSQQQRAIQYSQFMENWQVKAERAPIQFGWQREDLAFQGAQASLQYGWGQEDIQERLRYATGRERRQLMRQQERQTISYGMQMGQMETQGERIDIREQWSQEDLEREKRHFLERFALQDEYQSRYRSYIESRRQLEDELQSIREFGARLNIDMQTESLERQKLLEEQLRGIQDAHVAVGQQMENNVSLAMIFNKVINSGLASATTKAEALVSTLNSIKTSYDSVVTTKTRTP